MEPEITVHECHPSQIINLKNFVFAFLGFAAVIALTIVTGKKVLLFLSLVPAVYAFWKWMEVKSTKLTLTDQRLIIRSGIFTKITNETELYRVRDTSIEEPFFYRLFGVGNVIVYSTDEAEGKLHFNAYNKPHWIKDQIRNNAEISRQRKRWGTDNVLIHDLNQ
jgi:uncharacterized membrane protein YdbT with pleckstrin-like domain